VKGRTTIRLAHKIAVITGAGSGIGRASAILFAKEGAKVVVADINDHGGEETVAAITSSGGEAVFVHTDVSKASDAENLIRATQDKFGKIDILFNNAGTPQKNTPLENIDESLWEQIYAVNVKSVFLTMKYAIPTMKEAGSGVIINLASMGGVRPLKGTNCYASSKAAVIHLTKAVALELAPSNIRVNFINPAAVDTPMLPQFRPEGMDLKEFYKGAEASMPLGRIATPEDVAYAALYLASDESSILTGVGINVNGGRGI
jgi:3-oxoacyl-[acyl-carrier protein] reductase